MAVIYPLRISLFARVYIADQLPIFIDLALFCDCAVMLERISVRYEQSGELPCHFLEIFDHCRNLDSARRSFSTFCYY